MAMLINARSVTLGTLIVLKSRFFRPGAVWFRIGTDAGKPGTGKINKRKNKPKKKPKTTQRQGPASATH